MTAPGIVPLDREALFVALFDRLKTITDPAVRLFSRKLLDFDAACAAEQPAIYLVKGPEEISKPERSQPPAWKLLGEIHVYCRNDGDPNAAPSTQLNQLLTAIEGALQRQPDEGFKPGQPYAQSNDWWTTLDGLCSHCWISGPVLVGEGGIADQAVAVVPIEILATP